MRVTSFLLNLIIEKYKIFYINDLIFNTALERNREAVVQPRSNISTTQGPIAIAFMETSGSPAPTVAPPSAEENDQSGNDIISYEQ